MTTLPGTQSAPDPAGAASSPQSAPGADYALPRFEGLPIYMQPREDDPAWQAVRQSAMAAGITPRQLQALALPVVHDRIAESRAAYERELALLGPNAHAVVATVEAWLGQLVANGTLTKAERNALSEIGNADGVRSLAKIMNMIRDNQERSR